MKEEKKSKALNISLWVVQIVLALAFGIAGFMKITAPIDQLLQNGMSFVSNYSQFTIRFIGVTEVLAAIGLILPAALRVLPKLTPIAATGLSVVMILATQYHLSHNEPAVATIVLFLLAVFVVWGRFKKLPILSK